MEGKGRWLVGSVLAACAIGTAAIIAAGLGGDGSTATAAPSGAVAIPVVDCQTRIQLVRDSSPGPKSIAVGPVVFNGLRMWAGRSRDWVTPAPGQRWAAIKSPIYMEQGGAPATIILSPVNHGRVKLGVGMEVAPYNAEGTAVTVSPCPEPTNFRWTVFLAGFHMKGPTCLRISVQVEGEPDPIGPRKVALGRHSCRGK